MPDFPKSLLRLKSVLPGKRAGACGAGSVEGETSSFRAPKRRPWLFKEVYWGAGGGGGGWRVWTQIRWQVF